MSSKRAEVMLFDLSYGNIVLASVFLITWWLLEKQAPVTMRIIQGNVLSVFIVSCL